MAKKPANSIPELDARQYRELASVVLKQLPTIMEPKLVQYLIDHPLFTRAALEQFFAELQVPSFDSSYSGPLDIKSNFDANEALQKHGAVQGRKAALEILERQLMAYKPTKVSRPFLYWSMKPTSTRESLIMMRARKHRPAHPVELVAYIARGWRPQNGQKSLVALDAFYVDHQPHVLVYASNPDRQLAWTIEPAERKWPLTAVFLVMSDEEI